MAPATIDFDVKPFIFSDRTDDGNTSIGFGAAASVYLSGATPEQVQAMIDTYFTYKYAAAQLQVNSQDAVLNPERAQERWEVFALCQRAMTWQALQAASSDADLTFSLTRGDETEIGLSPKKLSFVPDDNDATQTPQSGHGRSPRGRSRQGKFTFVVRSGGYESSEQLVRDFEAHLDEIEQMNEPGRRIFKISQETQARLKTDILVELATQVPFDSIGWFDWRGAIDELLSQSEVWQE